MPNTTANYQFNLPLVNNATDQDLWGGYLNDNWTKLDGLLETATNWIHRAVTANDTATIADRNKIIVGDATIASYIQTLPSAATVGDGFSIAFVKNDATAHTITITSAGSDKIGVTGTTYILSVKYDSVVLISDGVSNWNFQSRSVTVNNATTSAAGIVQLATNAEVKTATDSTKALVPSSVLASPAAAKAWVKFTGATGAIVSGFNALSVVRSSTGTYTFNYTSAAADANSVPVVTCLSAAGQVAVGAVTAQTLSSVSIVTFKSSTGAAEDPTSVYIVVYGNA